MSFQVPSKTDSASLIPSTSVSTSQIQQSAKHQSYAHTEHQQNQARWVQEAHNCLQAAFGHTFLPVYESELQSRHKKVPLISAICGECRGTLRTRLGEAYSEWQLYSDCKEHVHVSQYCSKACQENAATALCRDAYLQYSQQAGVEVDFQEFMNTEAVLVLLQEPIPSTKRSSGDHHSTICPSCVPIGSFDTGFQGVTETSANESIPSHHTTHILDAYLYMLKQSIWNRTGHWEENPGLVNGLKEYTLSSCARAGCEDIWSRLDFQAVVSGAVYSAGVCSEPCCTRNFLQAITNRVNNKLLKGKGKIGREDLYQTLARPPQ